MLRIKSAQYDDMMDRARAGADAAAIEERFGDPGPGVLMVWGTTHANSLDIVIADPVDSIEQARSLVQPNLEDYLLEYEEMWVEECQIGTNGAPDQESCRHVPGGVIFELYDDGTGVFYAASEEQIEIPQQWILAGRQKAQQSPGL
jgi:hypothetical protein